jgi:hypothetical protein
MTENDAAIPKRDTHDPAPCRWVVCLFCGAHTSIPAAQRRSSGELSSDFHPWNVRCRVCGKEATYQAHEVMEAHELSRISSLRVRAVGFN